MMKYHMTCDPFYAHLVRVFHSTHNDKVSYDFDCVTIFMPMCVLEERHTSGFNAMFHLVHLT